MFAGLQRLDSKIRPYCGLLTLLCLLILLRLPNFFEPYWYGDEGIYLAIGIALRAGERLYAEIIDHKTPLIYYLAMTGTQFWFRMLLLGWMVVTTTAFYKIAHRVVSEPLSLLGTTVFILLTTLPWLEGNIPNGELFVMGFVLVGAALALRTKFVQAFLADSSPSHIWSTKDVGLLLLTGLLLGLGILTKVPALFDAVAVISIAWFYLTRRLTFKSLLAAQTWWPPIVFGFLIVIWIVIPILASIVYFVAIGSGQAYLDFGLLYNFRYAGSWNLPFTNPTLLWAFTLFGKAALAGSGLILLTLTKRWLSPAFQWLAAWSILALFASLLSNRPYPHYFLQVIPPVILVVTVALQSLKHQLARTNLKTGQPVFQVPIAVGLAALTYGIMQLIGVGYYPTLSYYQNWLQLASGQISTEEYYQRFNYVMKDNYRAAAILRRSPDPYIFIWGTNPMLYALSEKVPTGRFTVAFHIKDFDAYDETLQSVRDKNPSFIIVMNDDANSFPEFTEYLLAHYYMPNETFDNFTLWKRL